VPHGTGNGILLPHVMRFNLEAAGDKLALIARTLDAEGNDAAQAVDRLLARIGHPTRLSEVGVKAADLKACAELALTDPATITNPRAVTSAEQVIAVYQQAL
jgi:lactaldehyde reductase